MTHASLVVLLLCLIGCGGGGGQSESTPTSFAGADNDAAGGQNQDETGSGETGADESWSLERVTPETVGLDSAQIDQLFSHIYTDSAVQSATLVKDGMIIGERFAEGVSADTIGTSWSVAKSFYGAAIGVAIDQNWITGADQKVSDFITEWRGSNKEDVTVGQLLEMRAGIPDRSGLFLARDQTAFAIGTDKTAAAGVRFVYSNPTSQLFEPLLQRSAGLDAHAFLRQEILSPIGIDVNRIGMWLDPTGAQPLTYMGLDMRPEDFARFGVLMARGGLWEDEQILSSAFVAQSLSAKSPFYGYQWWQLNAAYFGQPVPVTVSAALGLDGQAIYVWPEADLVLVILTKYQHSRNQGYVLSETNFPDTCTGRGRCPPGAENVERYDQFELIRLLSELN